MLVLLFDTDYTLGPESHATKVEGLCMGLNNEALSQLCILNEEYCRELRKYY